MINVVEYEKSNLIDKNIISEEDRIFLNKLQYENLNNYNSRFIVQENKDGIYIVTQNFVGVIQLSKIKINIFPRFDKNFSQLINMISFCNNIDYKYYKKDVQSDKDILNLHDVIIKFLMKEIEILVKKGIFKEYIGYEKNLQVIRGRINMKKHITKNFLRGDKIYCNFEELDTDIIENQIILKALNLSSKITKEKYILKQIDKYKNIFREICSSYNDDKIPNINYNRLNNHYKKAHLYSKLIIENIGSGDVYKNNDNSCFSLLIDMNELFENFVCQLFLKYLSQEYRILSQKKITDAISDNNSSRYRDMIPDIYMENKETKEKIIIDTKNKNYGSKKVNNQDIYQLAFYGMYFSDRFKESSNIVIIYPKYSDCINNDNRIYLNTLKDKKNSPYIKIKGIDINEFLKLIEDERKNNKEIKEKLKEIII